MYSLCTLLETFVVEKQQRLTTTKNHHIIEAYVVKNVGEKSNK